MMLTPAQEHWQRTMATRRGDETLSSAALTAYELILHRLRIDQTRLSGLQGTERKIDYKRDIIAAYDSWIDGVLSADTGQADEVLTHIMIWQIDIGNYERALTLAEYVIRHNLPLPDRYHRTVGPLLVDEICDKALTIFAAGNAEIEPISRAVLEELFTLVAPLDMPNQVRAKLFKTLAYTLRKSPQQADKEQALSLMQQALLLFANIGVKKDIETLTRELKKADDAPAKSGAAANKTSKTQTTAAKKTASR
ncbi:phage terminase small subunit [Xenorhabdus innexi]|nr:phage terminase small subunit [Xenorhabdus innexi]